MRINVNPKGDRRNRSLTILVTLTCLKTLKHYLLQGVITIPNRPLPSKIMIKKSIWESTLSQKRTILVTLTCLKT